MSKMIELTFEKKVMVHICTFISSMFNLMTDFVNEFRKIITWDSRNILFDDFTSFIIHFSPNLLVFVLFTKLSILAYKPLHCKTANKSMKNFVELMNLKNVSTLNDNIVIWRMFLLWNYRLQTALKKSKIEWYYRWICFCFLQPNM